MNIKTTTPDKHKYLQILNNIDKSPSKLFYVGELPNTRMPTIAIVGTRKPTRYGKEVTYKFASELARKGIVIVSGLALGVDGIAHEATCEAGGKTIAVLPCGLPKIYPSSHQNLAKRILQAGGALLTEYDADCAIAYKNNFLERNRIVSGLADAILITEAASRSGTLNTASHALAQGKDVFVIPGNINSPMSAGCNALIQQGANVAITPDDIIRSIAPDLLRPNMSLSLGSNPTEIAILEQIKQGIRDGDEIQRLTKINATDITTSLTMLEINGQIRGIGANQWVLV